MATAQHQVPEWETPSSTTNAPRHSILNKFPFLPSNKATPATQKEEINLESQDGAPVAPRRKFSDRIPRWLIFYGSSRKLLFSSIAALVVLILIIGLAVGLTRSKGKARNLPLPTDGGIYNGDLTYYSPGPGYGACGWEHTSQDAICAVSHLVWDAVSTSTNPNHNPLCGKKLRITRFDPNQGRNNSVDVEVVDRCTGCKDTDIDLSLRMFEILADEEQGRVVGTWAWLDK